MKVLKFGGTSVGSPEQMQQVADLLTGSEQKVVVLSAVAGTTNLLEEITKLLFSEERKEARDQITELEQSYFAFIERLYSDEDCQAKASEMLKAHFEHIKSFTRDMFTIHEERSILAQGELISTALFTCYLEEKNIEVTLLPALDFMRTHKDGEPDNFYIKEQLNKLLFEHKNCDLFITQGYICRNAFGEIDNLKRGGSDYTASLIGAACEAEEIQIWTDIDGLRNNDPRVVDNTYPIRELSFNEAAELAYFGAKILHPSSLRPARENNIPVRLKNTMDPDAEGTLISAESKGDQIKAVAAKDGITAIKIRSGRMLLAHGFLRNIFEVFERLKTPIDMITTSEVAVSLTIDDTTHLDDIVTALENFGTVEVDHNQTIVCVVGDFLADKYGYAVNIFNSLSEVPIRMISYGGSRNNISLLISSEHKETALKALNEGVFNVKEHVH